MVDRKIASHIELDDSAFEVLFGCSKKEIAGKIILTPFGPLDRFLNKNDLQKHYKGKIYSVITVGNADSGYTVVKCPMGSGFAGDCVLFLSAGKIEKLIFVASCGGLGPVTIGDIIICESAYSGGGFSEPYVYDDGFANFISRGLSFSASSSVVKDLCSVAGKAREGTVLFKKGDIFTIGSLAAETRGNIEYLKNKGFAGIDMELAAVYHAAQLACIEVGGVLVTTDIPDKKPFWGLFNREENQEIKDSLKIAAKAAVSVLEGWKN